MSPMPVRPLLPPADPGPSRPAPGPAPGQPAPELPQPARPPAAEPEPAIPESEENLFEARAAEARIAAIASEAAAARAAPLAEQQRFTSRLVDILLSEQDGRVRARIVEEAATFPTAAAAAICNGGGDDPDPRVRAATCGVWERRGGPEAIAILAARGREDSDLGVRLRAIRGLGGLGEQQAIDSLVSLLDDPDPAVQDRVCRALGEATGQRLGNDPQTWRRWAADPEAFRRWSWLEGLRRFF
jgi:HEAT repeat protein